MKIEPGSLLYRIAISLTCFILKVWLWTLRVKINDPQNINRSDYDGQFIAVMWHNRIMSILPLFKKEIRKRGFAMSSMSKDGQISADIQAKFHIRTIRGSAAKEGKDKGGARALIQCIKALNEGGIICLIPDGPRGPKYEIQPGAVFLSAKSQVPLLPISINYQSYWELNSWDKLQIPKPFSKVEMVIGEMFQIEAKMDEESITQGKARLKEALMAITVDKR